MLQYLTILLDDTSTSFCHYENQKKERRLMPLDALQKGIQFGMMENLMIQFVYPDYELPATYQEAIDRIDHFNIKSLAEDADVCVINNWDFSTSDTSMPMVIRTSKKDLFDRYRQLIRILPKAKRVNVVFTDIETFTEKDIDTYQHILREIADALEEAYTGGAVPQLNLLTDRMMLTRMNNCGAGDTNITLAPNGKFYVCPAFYYEDETDSIGDLEHEPDIKNKQLYQLEYAPICRHCDAYQCKRCVWLNRKTTLEVNTPSHEQCVTAHLERNASRYLLQNIKRHSIPLFKQQEITEIDYLDPFDKRDEW